MSRDSRVKLAGITAAVTATAAAGYYAYDQYTKRYPRYQEQLDMYKEVRAGAVGWRVWLFLAVCSCVRAAGQGLGQVDTLCMIGQKADAVPDWGGGVCLSGLSVGCAAAVRATNAAPAAGDGEAGGRHRQAGTQMCKADQPPPPPGLQHLASLSHLGARQLSAPVKLAPVCGVLPVHCRIMRRCMTAWTSQTAAQS